MTSKADLKNKLAHMDRGRAECCHRPTGYRVHQISHLDRLRHGPRSWPTQPFSFDHTPRPSTSDQDQPTPVRLAPDSIRHAPLEVLRESSTPRPRIGPYGELVLLRSLTSQVRHPFVVQLGKGTLPRDAFEHYIKQDYHYLRHCECYIFYTSHRGQTSLEVNGDECADTARRPGTQSGRVQMHRLRRHASLHADCHAHRPRIRDARLGEPVSCPRPPSSPLFLPSSPSHTFNTIRPQARKLN